MKLIIAAVVLLAACTPKPASVGTSGSLTCPQGKVYDEHQQTCVILTRK